MQGLELIIGCMFSGKSTELIKRIRCHQLLERNVLCVTFINDKRYGENKIITHNRDHVHAIAVEHLKDIDKETITKANVICIEEAQFFTDLYDSVISYLSKNKLVIVCGLDGDFQANPFINVLSLIPLANKVDKLSALCIDCKDGTPAIFSKRISNNKDIILIGGSESYKCVCRQHFI